MNHTEEQSELEKLRQRIIELEKTAEEYKSFENHMKASEGHFQGILNNLLEGCQIINFDWRYTYVNDVVVKQSRLSREGLLGHTMMEVYPGIDKTTMFSALKDCMERRIPHRMENEFTFPDGSTGWFDLSIEPVPEGIFILSVERTEQKRLEEHTNQEYKLASIGQFAAGIAHDFNNILTVMMGTSQILSMNPDVSEKNREDLNTIYTQGKRASQLIKQILDFSRKTVVKREPVNLAPFMNEAIKLLDRIIPENIEIRANLSEEAPVNANILQLQQIIHNFASNSQDAMPEGGTIEIGLFLRHISADEQPPCPDMPYGHWVVWTFSDTGMGIPQNVVRHIFEPFFTTKPKDKGTGLGLAQVYGIVRQHNGFIDVETEEGKGTTFIIYFPAHFEKPESDEKKEMIALPKGGGQNILLVEDEELVLKILKIILENLGYEVLSASNGKEALKIYDAHMDTISLVLTDLVMPQMGGKELINTLLAKDPDLTFAVMSGYASDMAQYEDFIEKASGILEKPVTVEQMADMVSRALGKTHRP